MGAWLLVFPSCVITFEYVILIVCIVWVLSPVRFLCIQRTELFPLPVNYIKMFLKYKTLTTLSVRPHHQIRREVWKSQHQNSPPSPLSVPFSIWSLYQRLSSRQRRAAPRDHTRSGYFLIINHRLRGRESSQWFHFSLPLLRYQNLLPDLLLF